MEILGIPETVAAFARLVVEAEAGEKIAEVAGAKVIAKDMQARSPVDTGKMRSSIHVELTKSGAKAVVSVPYARFVEFGTVYQNPQPFVAESADEAEGPVLSSMVAVFKRILR